MFEAALVYIPQCISVCRDTKAYKTGVLRHNLDTFERSNSVNDEGFAPNLRCTQCICTYNDSFGKIPLNMRTSLASCLCVRMHLLTTATKGRTHDDKPRA
jgi:hypothetical protein